ncbi:hypothetical protein ACF09H_40050 [Streptomyces sp. NPDC014983]|uniref:hypothetical protein n=1 Tax=Streptomyces sp. NPDC014983 TaxID=3364933 RepID=UPI0036FD4354
MATFTSCALQLKLDPDGRDVLVLKVDVECGGGAARHAAEFDTGHPSEVLVAVLVVDPLASQAEDVVSRRRDRDIAQGNAAVLSDGQLAPRDVHVFPAHVPGLDAELWTASLYAVSFLPGQLHAHYFNLLLSGSGLTLRRSGGVLGEERLPLGDPGLPASGNIGTAVIGENDLV